MAVKTDDFTNIKWKIVTLCHESPAGIENEAILREIIS